MKCPGPGEVVARGAVGGPWEHHGCIGAAPHISRTERVSLFEESLRCPRCSGEWQHKLGHFDRTTNELVFEAASTYEIKRLPRTSPLPPEQNPNLKLARAILETVPSSAKERERLRQELHKRAEKAELARLRGSR